jgi:hypothetical protein
MLEPDNWLQPSRVITGINSKLTGKNLTDEDACPEESLTRANTPDKSTIITPEMLAALAATDEISDVCRRIASYIAIVPDIGSSFAYVDLLPEFEADQQRKEQILGDVMSHWKLAQKFMFNDAISLTDGIHSFINKWLTYGKLFICIIREEDHGKPIDIHVQFQELTKMTLAGKKTVWATNYNQKIWEQEDIFVLDWHAVDENAMSYVASIMRTYNMWTTVERTRVANAIMAAQFRSVYTVPTQGLGKTKARQKLSSVMSLYKRDIRIDPTTGATTVNGENSYPVNTELWVAETSQGSVKIDNPGDGNVQLNDTTLVEHFMRKFYKRAMLPLSKYEAVDAGYLNGLANNDEDERQFKLFRQSCRAALAKLFLAIAWRLVSVKADYVGRTEIYEALTMNWYDDPKNETPEEQLDNASDVMSKIKSAINEYDEVLSDCGFGEAQKKARLNALRVKLMRKYCPDWLEQTAEDYRNVPPEESPETDSSSGWSDDENYDDSSFESNGTDDFSDYSNDDWNDEFSGGDGMGDDWSMPDEFSGSDFGDFEW